jgi:hypothetical protein
MTRSFVVDSSYCHSWGRRRVRVTIASAASSASAHELPPPAAQPPLSWPSPCAPLEPEPEPEPAAQSLSSAAVHDAGQQPSPPMQSVIVCVTHAAVQLAALPVSTFGVHALLLAAHVVGHDATGSQVSPAYDPASHGHTGAGVDSS